MALEIMTQTRISKPEPKGQRMQFLDIVEDDKVQLVVPNFLHDLESFWWLHLWTMLRVDHPESSTFSHLLFKNSTEASSHRLAALSFGVHKNLRHYLHGSLKRLALSCDIPRGVIYEEYLKYDDIPTSPLSGEAPSLLMQLCDMSIQHAIESNDDIPNLKPFTSVVPEQPRAVIKDKPTSQSLDEEDEPKSRPTGQPAMSDQAKSAGSKSTRGRKPATSNGRSTTSSRITRSSSARKPAGGSESPTQTVGGPASKSVDEGTPREDGTGPARKIRRTS